MRKTALLLFVVLCLHLHLHAQSPATFTAAQNVSDVVSRLQTLSTTRLVEKAYLHLDKPSYNAGETIYFKAYVTAGENHQPSRLSGVLHADLINERDSIMQSITLHLNNGVASGDFTLPANTQMGYVRIRAYTRWMLNTGSKFFFDKTVSVTGKNTYKILDPTPGKRQPNIQFYPEGGTFVNGLPSRIAFKAIGVDGLGLDVKGTVVDNLNAEMVKFTTAHLGIGQFNLTPVTGKTYVAKVTCADGTSINVPLPLAKEKGMALSVNNDAADKISLDITANKAYYLENKNKEINIVIYSGGIVKTVKTVLDNQAIGLDVPTKDFKTGVMQVTVFNQNGMPLNERLAFIYSKDVLNLTAVTDKPAYDTQSEVKISLNSSTEIKGPAPGSFSVAVVNESVPPHNENTGQSILSHLLLSSELMENVEEPDYYFTNITNSTKTNLDILMRTQSYRHFAWDQLLAANETGIAYQPENGMQISGYMRTKDKRPLADEKITLFLSKGGQTLAAVTDSTGKFVFRNLMYADKTNLVLKVESPSLKNKAVITIDKNDFFVPVTVHSTPANTGNPNVYAQNLTADVDKQFSETKITPLKQVNVKAKNTYLSSNIAGSGAADQVIFSNEFKNYVTLSMGLTGKLRGVQFDKGSAYMTVNKVVTPGGAAAEPMLVVVDGMVGAKDIDVYNPNDVESVELLKGANATIYGLSGGAGVLIINTRQGGSANEYGPHSNAVVMSPGLVSVTQPGFYTPRQFNMPGYDIKTQNSIQRNTVFWDPDIITDKEGNATFQFNTKGAGSYKVTIEGIDTNGNIGRQIIKFKVQ